MRPTSIFTDSQIPKNRWTDQEAGQRGFLGVVGWTHQEGGAYFPLSCSTTAFKDSLLKLTSWLQSIKDKYGLFSKPYLNHSRCLRVSIQIQPVLEKRFYRHVGIINDNDDAT